MKIHFTILAALLFFMPMASDAMTTEPAAYENNETEKPTHFVLYLKSGERITFVIANEPRIVSMEEMISISENGTTIEYPLKDIHKYTMEKEQATGINSTINETSGTIKNEVGSIILSGFKAGVPVIVSNLNGMVVYKSTTDDNGSLSLSTSQYNEGVYIVKVQNKTFKFVKR